MKIIITLEIKIYEGKNREIRKILSYFKLTVKLLKRTHYGPFSIGKLNPGGITEIKDSKLKKYLDKINFKMRIISGELKGKILISPDNDVIRPTSIGVKKLYLIHYLPYYTNKARNTKKLIF